MKKIFENTPFVNGNKSLGITMLDFWKYQYSNIYDMQEYIAEFIVGKALGINEPMNRDGWTLWDIDYQGKRIEVKQAIIILGRRKLLMVKSASDEHSALLRHSRDIKIQQRHMNVKTTFMSFV